MQWRITIVSSLTSTSLTRNRTIRCRSRTSRVSAANRKRVRNARGFRRDEDARRGRESVPPARSTRVAAPARVDATTASARAAARAIPEWRLRTAHKVHSLCVREPTPHALSAVPGHGPVHLVGRRRGRLQADRRTAQARRHALDRRRRQRHHRPALLHPQWPLRGLLGTTSRKCRPTSPDGHLTILSCTQFLRRR